MPGNAETVIDYDCVPSYSQILAAQIVNMNDNVIIPHTSLKSGTITWHWYYKKPLFEKIIPISVPGICST